MRILAIDPGKKNIGLAISDPTGTIAAPLAILRHVSRKNDAAAIAQLATQHQAGMIVIGKSMDENGQPTAQSQQADRLAEAIRQQSDLPLVSWDESFSTTQARQARIQMGTSRKKRHGHLDDMAAVVILQSFLDAKAGA